MDILYIRNLKVDAVVGIFSWEKRIRQPLHLDLEIALDIRNHGRMRSTIRPFLHVSRNLLVKVNGI